MGAGRMMIAERIFQPAARARICHLLLGGVGDVATAWRRGQDNGRYYQPMSARQAIFLYVPATMMMILKAQVTSKQRLYGFR